MDAQEAVADGPSLILTPVDGTDTSMRAAAYSIGLARRGGAKLVCLFVHDPARSAMAATSAFAAAPLREYEEETARDLAALATERAASLGVPITFLHRSGDPYHEIIRAARENRADLIVVGASTSLTHQVAGSLSGRLVRARLCPVLVVP